MKAKHNILAAALLMPAIQAADINVFGTTYPNSGAAPAHADNAYQQASFVSTNGGIDGGLGTNIRVLVGTNAYTAGSTTNSNEVIWTKNNNYFVSDRLYIPKGTTLTIEPGTKVYFSSDDNGTPATRTDDRVGSIIACRGGKLIANGTAADPIVFTTVREWEAATGMESPIDRDTDVGPAPTATTAGLWGGLVLLGQATVSSYNTSNAAITTLEIEGFTPSGSFTGIDGFSDATQYGSDTSFPLNDNDNSGIVRYCSIRHGGYEFSSGREINGLTLGGVGRNTVIENVEVYANQDDGIEFFGGTVNTSNIVMAFNQDDSFDMDEGYSGTNQFWFGIQNPGAADGGFEADGISGTSGSSNANYTAGDNASRSSNPKIYNATIVGPGRSNTLSLLPVTTGSVNWEKGNHAMIIEDRFAGEIYNSVFDDFSGDLIRYVDAGTSTGTRFKFFNNTVGRFGNVAQKQIETSTFSFTSGVSSVAADATLVVAFSYGPTPATVINLNVPVTAGMTSTAVATEIRNALLGNSTIAGLYDIFPGLSATLTNGATTAQNILISKNSGATAQDANLNVVVSANATASSAASGNSSNSQSASNTSVDPANGLTYLDASGNPSVSDVNKVYNSFGLPLNNNSAQNTDPMFTTYTRDGSSFLSAINPIPQSGSSLLSSPIGTGAPIPVNYRGAFGNTNWAAGWTKLSQSGVLLGGGIGMADTDGDGISDTVESANTALGFNAAANDASTVLGTLKTQAQFDANFTAGQNNVVANPGTFNLYTASSIQELRAGGMIVGPVTPGGNAVLTLPLFKSTGLDTWEAAGNATATVPTPAGKQFFRVDLRPQN